MFCLITNGALSVQLSPYIAFQGWKVSRNDVDGPNAGRNILGDMIRDLVTTKRKIEITCIPMPAADLRVLLQLLDGESFSVVYDDVQYGIVTKQMYSNNFSWQYCQKYAGSDYYMGFGFSLIEM